MNIVYASNDKFARHLAVSLYSLLDRNQKIETLDVWVLSMGLSRESKDRLCGIAQEFDRELSVIELGNLKERFSHEVDTGGFDLSIMARLFLGDVLPEHVERVLYLDCDTVILSSLEKLWKADLGPFLLGAVMEPTIYPCIKEEIGLRPEEPYFNSGVLLIDLNRWREENVQKKLLDFYRSKGGKLFAGDQDTINGSLKGRIRPLSPRYNYFTNYRYFHYRHLVRLSPVYALIMENGFREAGRHPAILHFMGDERPWKEGNLNHYRRAYDKYLAKTPWAGTPKEKGNRFYMAAYHLMNYGTYLCPPFRDFISRHFGMKLVNSRKGS